MCFSSYGLLLCFYNKCDIDNEKKKAVKAEILSTIISHSYVVGFSKHSQQIYKSGIFKVWKWKQIICICQNSKQYL